MANFIVLIFQELSCCCVLLCWCQCLCPCFLVWKSKVEINHYMWTINQEKGDITNGGSILKQSLMIAPILYSGHLVGDNI